MDHLTRREETLEKQLRVFQKINRMEELSLLIEQESKKGDVYDRLETVNYVFDIRDFNKFCKTVYEDVKEHSRCKKRPKVMKKIGIMWKELSDDEKMMYKD